MHKTLDRITRRTALALAFGAACFAQNAAAQAAKYGPGASATEIKLGQTMPYSGPASAYGTIGKVEQAYFKMINENGGINGRKVNLISLDDGYSPPKAVEQVRRLVEQDEVLALFQTLGTPSNSAIQSTSTPRRCRTCCSRPARPSGAIRRTTRGRWASTSATSPRARSTRSGC